MGAPYGWIPTVTPFPRNDKSEWNASVGYIATLKLAMTMVCSFPSPGDCRAYARNDKRVGTHPHPNGHQFKVYLLTECAYSQTEHEPQGGENMSAELDGCTVRLRRVVA